jgi:hypothetical protein
MIHAFLHLIALISTITGLSLTFISFFAIKLTHFKTNHKHHELHHHHHSLLFGWIGVLLLFGSALVIIYFYSLQPPSQRIINEKVKNKNQFEIPDISILPAFTYHHLA